MKAEKKTNMLTGHQAERREVSEFQNKFALIEIEPKKNAMKEAMKAPKKEINKSHIDTQLQVSGMGKSKFQEFSKDLLEGFKPERPDRELFVKNAKNIIRSIRMNTKGTCSDQVIMELNLWEKVIDDKMTPDEKEETER